MDLRFYGNGLEILDDFFVIVYTNENMFRWYLKYIKLYNQSISYIQEKPIWLTLLKFQLFKNFIGFFILIFNMID